MPPNKFESLTDERMGVKQMGHVSKNMMSFSRKKHLPSYLGD